MTTDDIYSFDGPLFKALSPLVSNSALDDDDDDDDDNVLDNYNGM